MPGTQMSFDVTVTAVAPGGFNTADIVIGSDTAADVAFAYSASWLSAFSNVTPITSDTGFYAQDVYVGGNNAGTVGASLVLGTVTIDTAGMSAGVHHIKVDHVIDGVSTVGLAGVPESLTGIGAFEIAPPIPAMSHWGVAILGLAIAVAATLLVRRDRAGEADGAVSR